MKYECLECKKEFESKELSPSYAVDWEFCTEKCYLKWNDEGVDLNPRMSKFQSFYSDPMQGKLMKKLKKEELTECMKFIMDNKNLNDDDFVFKVNRWKLDLPKTKNHSAMWALIIQTKRSIR